MNSRRVFLLTVVLVLISMVGGFVTRTALGPNSIAQDGRFVVCLLYTSDAADD